MAPTARIFRYLAFVWFGAALAIAAFGLPDTVTITCAAGELDCVPGHRMNAWRFVAAGSAVVGPAVFVLLATIVDPHGPHRPATGERTRRSGQLRPSQARSG